MKFKPIQSYSKLMLLIPLMIALLILAAIWSSISYAAPNAVAVFINEIHYDNISGDLNEGVEVAGPAGTDLTGWSLVPYNGSNGTSYNATSLSGIIPDQQNGTGTVFFAIAGLQNGAPDGIALVDASSTAIQFLSYEGSFTATDGPANGLTSTDIGVVESNSTTLDSESLQLTGAGCVYEDFTWVAPSASTYDAVNTGQTFACAAPFSISKAVSPSSIGYQENVTYTVVLENGTAVSDTNVLFTDTLPVEVDFASWVEQPAGATVTANEITWSGTVTATDAITFTFIVSHTGNYGDVVTNTAVFSGTTIAGTADAVFTVAALTSDITFVYHDLEDIVLAGETVYIAGDFNSWSTISTPLTADAAYETFSVTVPAIASGDIGYKYIVNDGSDQWEWLNTNNRSYTVAEDATVDDYRDVAVGWANLQSPSTLPDTPILTATNPIYGQVYINNVTNSAGEGRGIMAEVGYGDNADPSLWGEWFPMSFNVQSGNNDEFMGVMTPTTGVGVFSYTTRFDGNWGVGNPNAGWTYGDLDGIPFSADQTGVITTTFASVPIATARAGNNGDIFAVEGKVIYVPGTYNGSGWALQDASGGIGAYYNPPPTVNLGDTIQLVGVRGSFAGEEQFTSVSYFNNLGSGPEVEPTPYTTGDVNAGNSEGWLVTVTGALSGLSCPSDSNFTVNDGSGDIAIYVDYDTGVDICAMGAANGDIAEIIGFSTEYNGAFQIKPRRPADVLFVSPHIQKSAPALVDPGESYTYTITVDNYLGYDLTNVVITDVLPISTTYVTASASDGGSLSGGIVSWPAASLAHGNTLTRTFQVTATSVTGTDMVNEWYSIVATEFPTTTFGAPVTTTVSINACGEAYTAIYDIQGSGDISPEAGNAVFTEGVVTAVFQDANQANGFYLQDEIGDGNAATSDGVFVYSNMNVTVGDAIRVNGQVSEYSDITEIGNVSTILLCGTGTITPTSVSLPIPTLGTWEQYEGMLVDFPQGLYATETYNLGRYGEVALSVNDRLYNPTNITTPGAAAIAQQELNDRSRITLDDAYTNQNRDPISYPGAGLTYTNTLRGGDYVANLVGVVDGYSSRYNIQPVGAVEFTPMNTRTAAPEDVGGTLTVASFNVLNYFNGDGEGGGFPTPRGANTATEFARQRIKIINAIVAIDADIIGLMEIENDGYDSLSAIQDLVNGLNDATAAGTYAFVNPGVSTIGTDAIAVGMLYKPANVTLTGSPAILDSSVISTFNDLKNRPALAQSFTDSVSGEIVTVAVNHLKSKGSACDDVGDPDTGDGQGNCNLTREAAAAALVTWLATDPTSSGSAYSLIIGDLNSYAMEDPITAITDAGYTNLLSEFGGLYAYSYVYSGQHGYLDHALASPALMPFVTGANTWHINSDEPRSLDYNEEFKTANQLITLYGEGPYRASDHDPVVIGLQFTYEVYLPIIMK